MKARRDVAESKGFYPESDRQAIAKKSPDPAIEGATYIIFLLRSLESIGILKSKPGSGLPTSYRSGGIKAESVALPKSIGDLTPLSLLKSRIDPTESRHLINFLHSMASIGKKAQPQ